jgi:multisubunit Na+/H+ antiporter MnhF subunit
MTSEATLWTAAALALVPPLGVGVLLCCRESEPMRLAAMQFIVATGTLFLVTLSFVLDEASSIDLALTFAFLGLPATLLFALFLERWL